MYVVIVGAGKVGWNLARELIGKGHEVTLLENNRRRYLTIEEELEHAVQYGAARRPGGHPRGRPAVSNRNYTKSHVE